MTSLRWAVVGTGGISRRTVTDLRSVEGSEVTSVVSRDQARADVFAAEWVLPRAFGDLTTALAADAFDALYVGTPHPTHYAIARAAMEAGKHVVCEKPLTMSSVEAADLAALAREQGVFLLEAMWMSFSPAVRRVLDVIGSGEIGRPRLLQAGLGFAVPEGARRYWEAELGGGALYDMGVYSLTLGDLVLGDVASIHVVGDLQPDGVDLEDTVTLRYADGGTASLMTSIVTFIPPRGWIGGTKGSIDLGERLFSPESLRIVVGRPPEPPHVRDEVFPLDGSGYLPMFRAAAEAIRAGEVEHPWHPHSRTVRIQELMERIRSALQG
jgi:predicted dehydrogenase